MRPLMRSQIMHIPTGLYLQFCYYQRDGEIHLVLTERPAEWTRNNLDLFDTVSDPSWDNYLIHIGDTVFPGTCDEFVLVEQKI